MEKDLISKLDEKIREKEESINLIILSTKPSDKEAFVTAEKIAKKANKQNIESYILFADNGYLKRQEDGTYFAFNIDDKKGFKVDSNKTVLISRESVGRKMSTLDLLSQFEKANIFCINGRECIEVCKDKYRTILKLVDSGISCPKTAIIQNEDLISVGFEKIGGKFPVVIKTLFGHAGVGVFIADSWKGLHSTIQAIWKINPDVEMIIQEYIESKFDYRVHVLGNKVIAAMKRFVIKDDFRSNFSLGGKIEKAEINEKIADICIKASKAVGGLWTGVDIILDKNGNPYVLEVNSSPGTEGIEQVGYKNVIDDVINFASLRSNWQKATTEVGYKEVIKIDELGELVAKFDTGNGVKSCSIHCDSFEEKDEFIIWSCFGKKMKTKNLGKVKIKKNNNNKEMVERPLTQLTISFNGSIYKDIPFNLNIRDHKTSAILINREFMKIANLSVNPAKRFIITQNPEIKDKLQEKFEKFGI